MYSCRGSPCLASPFKLKYPVEKLFFIIQLLPLQRKVLIRSIYFLPNPDLARVAKMKACFKESKAFPYLLQIKSHLGSLDQHGKVYHQLFKWIHL